MALTKEQRRRIEQEEQLKMEGDEYRAEVRKRQRMEPEQRGGGNVGLRIVLILFVAFIGYLYLTGALR